MIRRNKTKKWKKIRPSEEITCMNDRECKPENCPHHENHTQKTYLDMLEKEDDDAYLFVNCCAVDASCYECGLEHGKKLNKCRFCLCFDCMNERILNPKNAKRKGEKAKLT